jgi:hypothetical protein
LEKGVNIVTISKLYGHSNVLVTQRYLHPKDELSIEAVELLAMESSKSTQNEEDLLRSCDAKQKDNQKPLVSPSFSIN